MPHLSKIFVLWLMAFAGRTFAFSKGLASNQQIPRSTFQRTPTRSALHCICVDCARVTNCAAYHFVETKHEQPHMTDNPTFTPRDGSPTIHVDVRTIRTDDDRQAEMDRMWREYKDEEQKAEANQQEGGKLRGEKVYDFTPVTTYEYDV
ncbi:predicted protein, partial [Phaeodactylum tricornutum CCAP 1055/1]